MGNTSLNKNEEVPIGLEHNGVTYQGSARPLATSCREGVCYELDVTLNGEHLGTIYCGNDYKWHLQHQADQGLTDKIGEQIFLWYDQRF
jgi:hypothetical protein